MKALLQHSPLSSFLRKLVVDQHARGSKATESVRLEIITDNAKVHKRRSQCVRRSSSSESFSSAIRGNVDAFESEYEASCRKMAKQSNAKGTSTSRWNSLERPSFSRSTSAPALLPTRPTRRISIEQGGREKQSFPDMSLALAYLQEKYAGKQDNKTSKTTTRTVLEPCSKATTAPTIPTRRESIDEFYIKQAFAATLSITDQHYDSSRDA
jgi:hypothetical protein